MDAEVIATVLTGAAVLVGVWRITAAQAESIRRDLTNVDRRLTAQITAVNDRIDNILLADRRPAG